MSRFDFVTLETNSASNIPSCRLSCFCYMLGYMRVHPLLKIVQQLLYFLFVRFKLQRAAETWNYFETTEPQTGSQTGLRDGPTGQRRLIVSNKLLQLMN